MSRKCRFRHTAGVNTWPEAEPDGNVVAKSIGSTCGPRESHQSDRRADKCAPVMGTMNGCMRAIMGYMGAIMGYMGAIMGYVGL